MPERNATASAARATQLGRDALLVHGVALLFAAAHLAVVFYLEQGTHDWIAAFFISLIAAVVIGVWSVVFAFRALLTGEPAGRPMAVLALLFLECTAASFIFLGDFPPLPKFANWYVVLGLPVLVPVFTLASLIALPVARWRVRRNAGMAPAAAAGPWPWKRALAWYCAVAALTAVLLLPCPLFLFAVETRSDGGPWPEREYGWRSFVIEKTPIPVGEVVAWTLSLPTQKWAATWYGRVLETGRVTERRLIAELDSRDYVVRSKAEAGLGRADPASELERAERVGNRELITTHQEFLDQAGTVMGTRGSAETVRRFLDVARTPPPPAHFLTGLVNGTMGHLREFRPDLERLVETDSSARGAALAGLAIYSRHEDVERLWRKQLADSNPARRVACLRATPNIQDADARIGMLLLELERKDRAPLIQWWGACYLLLRDDYERAKVSPRLLTRLVECLLPLLDNDNGRVRWMVAFSLANLTNVEENLSADIWKRIVEEFKDPPPPETADDAAVRDQLRDHVKKWLAQRKEEKK